MFVVSLDSARADEAPGGERIGINQIAWDAATRVLHVEVDRLLEQHRRYGVIVTSDVLDAQGKKVKKTEAFEDAASATAPPWYSARLRVGPLPETLDFIP